MSVARAVLEHCADKRKLGAKTMFATHYHELTVLEDEIEGVKNFNISAKKRGDDIIFLRKIVPGGADDSYGIEVAGLAGVPESVIKRAKSVLRTLESSERQPQTRVVDREPDSGQLSLLDMSGNEIVSILKNTDFNTLTPIEAMNLLFELKKKC
jgi:DNA mismatch repair protein MutS